MRGGGVLMATSILLGWPIGGESQSKRYRPKTLSDRYADLSRASHYTEDGHLLTFAPTGAGKGVRAIIPNLLHYTGPAITVDPKGENFAVTANYRRKQLGQKIYLLDPFEQVEDRLIEEAETTRASFNPLDLVRSFGSDFENQILMMSTIITSGRSGGPGSMNNESFWNEEAKKLITGAIGARIVTGEATGKRATFRDFISTLFADDVVYQLAVLLDNHGKLLGKNSAAYRGIAAFLQKADKERSGVASTAQSYLTPFLADGLNAYLNSSSFSHNDIASRDDYTIYIVIPPSKLSSHSLLLRLWIATLMSIIAERREKPEQRTLFLLDECAQLGTLDELRKAVTLLRGYGLQVWMFFQDLSQLSALYGNDFATMINNCGVLQAFGMSRNFAAQPIADIIGRYEARDLVGLDRSQQVISTFNQNPRVMRLLNYLEDGAFAGRYSQNPLFRSPSKEPALRPYSPNPLRQTRV
jgi:type IV secretion system protein VirD4